jgi:dTDP-4-amino-4,6-dideoxygalactose transaminase
MSYKIPLFDLNFDNHEEEAVLNVLRSKWISMGSYVNSFENEFKEILKIEYTVAVSSCTAALHMALRLLDIKTDDEVIVPSFTFVATVNSILYVGAKPVFADISSTNDFSIDPEDIEDKITGRTKAIIVVHYGGFSCNMDKIMKIANKHNLPVIEDAAHAPGAEFNGQKLGTIGDIGCFSFFSNKNITSAEGGMLVTQNESYYKKALLLRAHGMTTLSYDRAKGHATAYDVIELGYNYRMDDIRGAIVLAQLKKLEDDLIKREELRNFYVEMLQHNDHLIVPYLNVPHRSSNYIFPVLLKNGNSNLRDKIRNQLALAGIETSVHYPAVHRFSIYSNYIKNLPKTNYTSDNEITLPLYYNLKTEQIEFIVTKLKSILNKVYSKNKSE